MSVTKVLIVENEADLGTVWQGYLRGQGCDVVLTTGAEAAILHLRENPVDVLVVNLVLPTGGAMAIADFCGYRWPQAKVIFVTNTTFFSDGSIFQHCGNAAALLRTDATPEDLGAIVEHCARPPSDPHPSLKLVNS